MEIGLGLSRSSIANNEILILLPFIDNNNFNVMAIKLRFENVYKNTGNIEFNTTPIRLEKGTYYYKLDYGQADENKDTDIFETTLLPY